MLIQPASPDLGVPCKTHPSVSPQTQFASQANDPRSYDVIRRRIYWQLCVWKTLNGIYIIKFRGAGGRCVCARRRRCRPFHFRLASYIIFTAHSQLYTHTSIALHFHACGRCCCRLSRVLNSSGGMSRSQGS